VPDNGPVSLSDDDVSVRLLNNGSAACGLRALLALALYLFQASSPAYEALRCVYPIRAIWASLLHLPLGGASGFLRLTLLCGASRLLRLTLLCGASRFLRLTLLCGAGRLLRLTLLCGAGRFLGLTLLCGASRFLRLTLLCSPLFRLLFCVGLSLSQLQQAISGVDTSVSEHRDRQCRQ
jgi:hypothetical protein